jgi:hypothetical protein
MTAEELSNKKNRFYATLEAKLVAWVVLSLGIGVALALPSLLLAISSMGGMLVILKLAMRDPLYIRLRDGSRTAA